MVGNTTMSIYWFFTSNFNSPNPSIFLNLTYPLRKNISFPKCLEITQKFTQNRKTMVNQISIWIWRCLKRERDIGRKALSSDGQTAFTFTPALSRWNRKLFNFFHVYLLVNWIWLSIYYLLKIRFWISWVQFYPASTSHSRLLLKQRV